MLIETEQEDTFSLVELITHGMIVLLHWLYSTNLILTFLPISRNTFNLK